MKRICACVSSEMRGEDRESDEDASPCAHDGLAAGRATEGCCIFSGSGPALPLPVVRDSIALERDEHCVCVSVVASAQMSPILTMVRNTKTWHASAQCMTQASGLYIVSESDNYNVS